jgi:hypothetical protein
VVRDLVCNAPKTAGKTRCLRRAHLPFEGAADYDEALIGFEGLPGGAGDRGGVRRPRGVLTPARLRGRSTRAFKGLLGGSAGREQRTSQEHGKELRSHSRRPTDGCSAAAARVPPYHRSAADGASHPGPSGGRQGRRTPTTAAVSCSSWLGGTNPTAYPPASADAPADAARGNARGEIRRSAACPARPGRRARDQDNRCTPPSHRTLTRYRTRMAARTKTPRVYETNPRRVAHAPDRAEPAAARLPAGEDSVRTAGLSLRQPEPRCADRAGARGDGGEGANPRNPNQASWWPPNGSRLSCGRAHTTLAPTGRRRRSCPGPDGGRPRPPHAPDRGRQLQPLVRPHPRPR